MILLGWAPFGALWICYWALFGLFLVPFWAPCSLRIWQHWFQLLHSIHGSFTEQPLTLRSFVNTERCVSLCGVVLFIYTRAIWCARYFHSRSMHVEVTHHPSKLLDRTTDAALWETVTTFENPATPRNLSRSLSRKGGSLLKKSEDVKGVSQMVGSVEGLTLSKVQWESHFEFPTHWVTCAHWTLRIKTPRTFGALCIRCSAQRCRLRTHHQDVL